jgi:hypothetical protein
VPYAFLAETFEVGGSFPETAHADNEKAALCVLRGVCVARSRAVGAACKVRLALAASTIDTMCHIQAPLPIVFLPCTRCAPLPSVSRRPLPTLAR